MGEVIGEGTSGEDIYASCVSFRRKMEEGKAELEEAFEFLSRVSSILLARIRSLLPARTPEPEEDPAEVAAREASATLGLFEIGPETRKFVTEATRRIEESIDRASALYPRGIKGHRTPAAETAAGGEAVEEGSSPVPQLPVDLGVSPVALARMWFSLKSRADARTRIVAVPKLGFIAHLRRIWRAVLTAAKRGVRLKFSVFTAEHPKWMKVMDFLALLELVRLGRVWVWQEGDLGEIEFAARETYEGPYVKSREEEGNWTGESRATAGESFRRPS